VIRSWGWWIGGDGRWEIGKTDTEKTKEIKKEDGQVSGKRDLSNMFLVSFFGKQNRSERLKNGGRVAS